MELNMKLVLKNFRCYEDTEIDLAEGVTLIKGESGIGKTTIANAIDYALYGKLQKPYTHGKKKCSVELIFTRQIKIFRQSGPKKLTIHYGDEAYYQDVAQSLIDKIFGSYEVFNASSYLIQGERCPLMTTTNANKMALIRSISFRDDKVTEVQGKIKSSLKVAESNVNSKSFEVKAAKRALVEFDKKHQNLASSCESLDEQLDDPERTLKELSDKSQTLDSKIEELRTVMNNVNRLEGQIQALDDLVNDDKELTSKAELEARLEQLANELEELRVREQETVKLQANLEANKKISELRNLKKSELEQLESEIEDCYETIGDRDPDKISSELKRLEKIRNKAAEIQKVLAKANLESRDEMVEQKGAISQKLREAKAKLFDLEDSLKAKKFNQEQQQTLQCPKCSAGLRFKDNKLHIHDENFKPELKKVDNPDVTESDIMQQNAEIVRINERKEQIDKCNAQVADIVFEMPRKNKSDDAKYDAILKLQSLSKRVEALQKELAGFGETDNESKDSQNNEDLKEGQLDKIRDSQKSLLNELQDIKLKISNYDKTQLNKQKLQELKDELGDSNSEKIKEKISQNSDELNSTRTKIELIKALQQRVILFEKYQKLDEELNQLTKRASNLAKMYELSKSTEREVLQQTVAVLNLEMEKFLNVMFVDNPIKVEFSTTRKLKSRKGVSATCSLKIFYKNVQYDEVKQLSGGEKDRVSLAMSMAINSIVDSGLIILDETLSALHAEMKITLIKTLEDFCSSDVPRVAIVISHEGVEGVYTNVMDLDAAQR